MRKKILWGISGIGNGHINRQLPLIRQLAKSCQIMIFCYDKSYEVAKKNFLKNKNITLQEVSIPFWSGGKRGLDFSLAQKNEHNQNRLFFLKNCEAMAMVQKKIGKPDLVISDYEPISAQYAYAYNAPLITIDQQSKFLVGNFPKEIAGFNCQDEIERLHMFFPKVEARLAVSFFNVEKGRSDDSVLLFPPIIKDAVLNLKRTEKKNSILVYISAARAFGQTNEQIRQILSRFPEAQFSLFTEEQINSSANVVGYKQGDERFLKVLSECTGIITTAGHTLLSEAMYLGIPVYALPVAPYEQHLNAYVINKYGFGLASDKLQLAQLKKFLSNLNKYKEVIRANKDKILLNGVGQDRVVEFLNKKLG